MYEPMDNVVERINYCGCGGCVYCDPPFIPTYTTLPNGDLQIEHEFGVSIESTLLNQGITRTVDEQGDVYYYPNYSYLWEWDADLTNAPF